MNGAELSAPLLGLPLLLVALLLLALWIALRSRAASNWSSLFGGVVAVATVWLFATVALDRVWDVLWWPRDPLGDWLQLPNVIAALIALLSGGWLERRLRTEELGPVLTGVLDGGTPRNLYEWAASIGFLAFAIGVMLMLSGPENIALNLSGTVIWLSIAGSIATGGGLLAGGMSGWRTSGRSTRVALLVIAGLAWCLAMDGLGRRLEAETRTALANHEEGNESFASVADILRARIDGTPEERAAKRRMIAWMSYYTTGGAGEYEDEHGMTVPFEPTEEEQTARHAWVLMPSMLRDMQDDATTFRSLWPWVALAGLALGLLRPLRAAPRDAPGAADD